jgi:integrase
MKKVRTIYPFAKGRRLTEIVDVAEALKVDAIKNKAAPATVNRKLAILRRVARLSFRQWAWLAEPLGDRITLLPGERQRHTYLTPAEVKRLARAAPAPVRDAILLAALTGLRRSELLGLKAQDRKHGALVLQDTKNGRPRIVPLPPEAARIRLPLDLTINELAWHFRAARVKARLPHVRFHDLRHTYASWLLQSGASLTAARDLLGHSSLSVTSRYSHLSQAHLVDAVKGLPRLAGMAGTTRGRKKAA